MRRLFAVLTCIFLLTPMIGAEEPFYPDDGPASSFGGLFIVRRGDTTTWSLGGGLFPRYVKVKIATPEGPVVTHFTLPSNLPAPGLPFLPECAPARLWLTVPGASSVVYVEGERVLGRGTLRLLESPILQPGRSYPLLVRVASIIGENLVVEDKVILLRTGANVNIVFDGNGGLKVPLAQIESRPIQAK